MYNIFALSLKCTTVFKTTFYLTNRFSEFTNFLVYSPEWSSDHALGNGISAWRPKNEDPAPWISIKLKEKYKIQAIQGKISYISTVP